MSFVIFNPDNTLDQSTHRGGGRFIQLLKENLSDEAEFVTDLTKISSQDTLLIPFWNPFQKPTLSKKIAQKQFLTIFDVIPLKYPEHFPIGIKGTLNLWRNRQSLKYYDGVITISEASKRDIVTYLHIPEEKIHVNYLTVPKIFTEGERASPHTLDILPKENRNSEFILYVGDVNWNKNLVNLAKAVKLAHIPCVFVGKAFSQELNSTHPWLTEFNEFKKEINNDPGFIFPGYVSDEELIQLYRKALCNILISKDEGFGLSYLEASSQKCPSILSNISVFKEIAQDKAIFVDPHDPKDIAEKITKISEDKTLRKDLAEKTLSLYKIYTPSFFSQKLLKVIK